MLSGLSSVKEVFSTLRERHVFEVVKVADILCADGICEAHNDGRPLYRDDDHLSREGCLALSSSLRLF